MSKPAFMLPSAFPHGIQWNDVVIDGSTFHTLMVTGSREFNDLRTISDALQQYAEVHALKHPDVPLVLISGHAQRGADVLAEMVWANYGPVLAVPADWETHTPSRCKCHADPTATYCKLAGIIRNELMVDDYKPSVCLAFYATNAENRGTNHASEYASSKGVPVRTFMDTPAPLTTVTEPAPLEVPTSEGTSDAEGFASASM